MSKFDVWNFLTQIVVLNIGRACHNLIIMYLFSSTI